MREEFSQTGLDLKAHVTIFIYPQRGWKIGTYRSISNYEFRVGVRTAVCSLTYADDFPETLPLPEELEGYLINLVLRRNAVKRAEVDFGYHHSQGNQARAYVAPLATAEDASIREKEKEVQIIVECASYEEGRGLYYSLVEEEPSSESETDS